VTTVLELRRITERTARSQREHQTDIRNTHFSKLDKNYIYIAEQNWDNKKWNNTYSRKIPYSLGVLNSVLLIDKNIFNVSILGWISIDNLDRHIFYPQLNSRFNI
jgi:hypothetical protein